MGPQQQQLGDGDRQAGGGLFSFRRPLHRFVAKVGYVWEGLGCGVVVLWGCGVVGLWGWVVDGRGDEELCGKGRGDGGGRWKKGELREGMVVIGSGVWGGWGWV